MVVKRKCSELVLKSLDTTFLQISTYHAFVEIKILAILANKIKINIISTCRRGGNKFGQFVF